MRSLVCKSINFEPMQSEVRIAVKKMSKDLNNEILISFISLLRAVVSVPDNSPELQKELEDDLKIQRALKVTRNIEFYRYVINFKLEKAN